MQIREALENRFKLALPLTKEQSPSDASSAPQDDRSHRLLGITTREDGNYRVDIDSTGLSLDEKVRFEKIIRSIVSEECHAANLPEKTVSTYFRRPGVGGAPAPVPASRQAVGAFGVQFARRAIPGVRSVVAVASGKGGVGKSTVSTNLAVSLAASGKRVGFLDADIYGPSATLMFGVQGPIEVNAKRRLLPKEAYGVKVMSMGLLYDANAPAMWRGPMVVKALEQLMYDTDWEELDVLVIDLPPGTGDVQLTLIEKLPLAGAIVVTTPQDVALIDARKAYRMFEKLGIPIIGMIENMSTHHCSHCGHEEEIFGAGGVEDFLRENGSALLAKLPLAADIRIACDSGKPAALATGAAAEIFQKLGREVSKYLLH